MDGILTIDKRKSYIHMLKLFKNQNYKIELLEIFKYIEYEFIFSFLLK